MLTARLVLDKDFTVGNVDPRVFGGFVEHMGRCIYEAMYEPNHPDADEDGFRPDVIALFRELQIPVLRYPGGNFVSSYNWEDGVGPREQRPRRTNLAWRSCETNQFGTNEFMDWCKKAGTEPMLAVNLGLHGAEDAGNLVEYCNLDSGTYYSDLRKTHGYTAPHNVKLWCLGNELDAPSQIGHKTSEEYGREAFVTANLMKRIDPSIELVMNGTCAKEFPHFINWDVEVIDQTFEFADYLSIHRYNYDHGTGTPNNLAQAEVLAEFIEQTVTALDYVSAKKRSKKRIMLSLDEWNVLPKTHMDSSIADHGQWPEKPPIFEGPYRMEDALGLGGMIITILNHCDRVKIACLSELFNVAGCIWTQPGGGAFRQTTFYPFAQASALARGTVLHQAMESPGYENDVCGNAPYLLSSSVYSEDDNTVTVLAVNRNLDEPLELDIDLRSFGNLQLTEWQVLHDDDIHATNTFDVPCRVVPKREDYRPDQPIVLRAASWNVLRFTV